MFLPFKLCYRTKTKMCACVTYELKLTCLLCLGRYVPFGFGYFLEARQVLTVLMSSQTKAERAVLVQNEKNCKTGKYSDLYVRRVP